VWGVTPEICTIKGPKIDVKNIENIKINMQIYNAVIFSRGHGIPHPNLH